MEVTCKRLENGDLRVTMEEEDRLELATLLQSSERNYWAIMAECFESYSCNGGYTPFDAGDGNPFVGLTSAPCIAQVMDYHEDGKMTIDGDFWYYANYCITDPLDELAASGETIFQLAR